MEATLTLDALVATPPWLRQIKNGAVPPAFPSPRILLVDNHELVRAGVKALYAQLQGVAVTWVEADSLEQAVSTYGREGDFDLVLLDLNLPDCRGLRGLQLFRMAHPKARIAAFSGSQDEFIVRQARALGAAGFVCKGLATAVMREVFSALLWPNGGPESNGPVPTSALFPRFPTNSMYERVAQLGARHLEILELVLSGCTNQEIGNATRLSLGTIKNYVSSLLLALDVKSRAHLISLFR